MVSLCCPMAGDPGLPFWTCLVRPRQIRAPPNNQLLPVIYRGAVGLRSFSPLGESSPALGSAGEQGWEAGACSLGSIPSC